MSDYNLIKASLDALIRDLGGDVEILDIITDPESHDDACGCLECTRGHEFVYEYFDDTDEPPPEEPQPSS
ncbi:MAG: hypothetical protein P1V36_00070 [Planctomycetota bacterium]|nr:hypothetical protein [Planctomycetota bacterium]